MAGSSYDLVHSLFYYNPWLPFGGLLAWAQVGEDKTFAGLSKGYIFTLRCTPPIVLLFLVFYGLPEFLKWWLNLDINNWSKTVFVLFTMVLLFAAIIAEVFKVSYQAIQKVRWKLESVLV